MDQDAQSFERRLSRVLEDVAPGLARLPPLIALQPEQDRAGAASTSLPDTIDLLPLDGAKALYPDILSLVESRLRPSALIVADNADHSPDYLARVRAPESGYLSTPFAEEVELSMRLG
ncbi:MAG TPA: hypothetical protein VMA54_04445 [Steroidobacteraceae bacterium]|nr:hypothetical protein [Steroidobacteraceae bacterium]